MTSSDQLRIPDHVAPDRVHYFDIYNDAGLLKSLHQSYSRLHAEAPDVLYTPANGGHWMVTRYDAILEILLDPTHFSNAESQIPRVKNPPKLIPLSLDPPDNLPYRQILMPYFSPKAVAAMDAQMLDYAERIVGELAGKGRCDFLAQVAAPYPVTIFMLLMGLPLERLPLFRHLVHDFFNAQGHEHLEDISKLILGEMAKILDERRAEPREDLVSFLLASQIEGRALRQDELLPICFVLFLGGLDTVTNAMSFAANFLAKEPSLQDRLIAEPPQIDNFVDEALRLFGVANVPRLVTRDVERLGVKFRAGEMVLCALPMAGWDDRKNADPALFCLDRKDRRHLTFGSGTHLCLGRFLARSELKKMFSEWMSEIGRFRLAPGEVTHFRAGTIMSLDHLNLEWDAASA